jgi:hypothetical protein
MKRILRSALILLALAVTVTAADPRGRVDTRKLAGAVNYTQDEFDRQTKPVILTTGLFSYNITNDNEGLIFVAATNITGLVHIGLPNPTNNLNRRFHVIGTGPLSVVLTNTTFTGTFSSNLVVHASYLVSSNRSILAFSTGTNYICKDY